MLNKLPSWWWPRDKNSNSIHSTHTKQELSTVSRNFTRISCIYRDFMANPVFYVVHFSWHVQQPLHNKLKTLLGGEKWNWKFWRQGHSLRNKFCSKPKGYELETDNGKTVFGIIIDQMTIKSAMWFRHRKSNTIFKFKITQFSRRWSK